MEATALRHSRVEGLRGPTPLLRLQSDERLVTLTRRGNQAAYEALVARYQARLIAFCRHMLGSREDAEDVLQEVFAAAFNAMLADDRPINVRPWLYRIARNRALNHLRRAHAIGVDSMDVHYADSGTTTADKVHKREDFRLLIADVQQLAETQRTALVLREIDALSYEQIAEAMETTIPSVKSLLVRARVSLAEAAEARALSCESVRLELGEVAEGLRRISPPVRRHLRECERCAGFRKQLRETNKALAAIFPVGPLLLLKKLLLANLGTSASAGGGAAAATAAGTSGGMGAGGAVGAGLGAVATKAAAGLAAAALVTAGAVEVDQARTHIGHSSHHRQAAAAAPLMAQAPPQVIASEAQPVAQVPAPKPAPKPVARPAASADAAKRDRTPAAQAPAGAAKATAPTLTAAPLPAPQQEADATTLPPQVAGSTSGGITAPATPPVVAPSTSAPTPATVPPADPATATDPPPASPSPDPSATTSPSPSPPAATDPVSPSAPSDLPPADPAAPAVAPPPAATG